MRTADRKDRSITVRLDDKTYVALKAYAVSRKLTISEAARSMIKQLCDRQYNDQCFLDVVRAKEISQAVVSFEAMMGSVKKKSSELFDLLHQFYV